MSIRTISDQASLDAWLSNKIETELADQPNPDWGGVFGMFICGNDLPLTQDELTVLYNDAVEYGKYLSKESV